MSQVQIGQRVQINSFKYKGLEGTVKFLGEVAGKIGQWVGVELDVPRGDMDGTVDGNFLFECQPSQGLLLRQTQVKIIEINPNLLNVPQLNMGGMGEDMSDSPLLTPKDPPTSKMQNIIAQGIQRQAQAKDTAGDQEGNKLQGWKERLQKIRDQKQQNQAPEETKKEELKPEEQELKKMFAPAAGIQRGKDGKLQVQKDQVIKSTVPKIEQSSPQKLVDNFLDEDLTIPDDKEEKKKAQIVQKIGTGLKGLTKATTLRPGTSMGVSSKGNAEAQEAIKDAQKEKLLKKNEELKDKLNQKQEQKQPTTARSTLASQQQKQKEAAEKAKLEADKVKEVSKQEPALQSKPTLKKPGTEPPAKVAPGGLQRAQTARPTKEEVKKEEPVKKSLGTTGLKGPAAQVGAGLKSKLLGPKATTETTKTITEEDEEPLTIKSSPNKLPSQKNTGPIKKEEPNTLISATGQSLQQKIINDQQNQQNEMAQSFGGVSQLEFKKLETDLRKKKEEVYSLQIEVTELSDKLQNQQKEHSDKIEQLQTEYEIKYLELEAKLQDTTQLNEVQTESQNKLASVQQESQNQLENIQQETQNKLLTAQQESQNKLHSIQQESQSKIQELTAKHKQEIDTLIQTHQQQQQQIQEQIKQLTLQKTSAEGEVQVLKKQLEKVESERDQLKIDVEAKVIDLETMQLEMEALKDEKEDLINQIQMSNEMQQEDSTSLMTQDELRNQNQKLRQAIASLTMSHEVEKSKLMTKIKELNSKAELVDEQEKKLEDMDLLLEEVELKEQEIQAMNEKLEECLEYEKMVEEMAQDLLKKEEEAEQMMEKIIELEENNAIQEEINENQEQYVKELNDEIAAKESEIFEAGQNAQQLEDMVLEQDEKIQKYKEKFKDLNEKNKLLNEELQGAYQAGDSKVRISQLIEKQNQLIAKLRDASKKDLEIMVQKIDFQQEKLRQKVIESFIPIRLVEQTKLDSLEKIQLLNKTRNKALLLIRAVCEKHLQESQEQFEDKQQWLAYVTFLIGLCDQVTKFIEACNRIMFCICKMSGEKYSDVTTRLMAWNKFTSANQFFDGIIQLLQEESLTPKFDISQFLAIIKSLQDLQANIEFKYVEKLEDQEDLVASQERQKDVKNCYKLTLRNQCLKMALGVVSVGTLTNESGSDILTKSKLIYWRLLDIILKLDNIDQSDGGQEYINLLELGTDSRLEQKFNMIKVIWEAQGIEAQAEAQVRDWTAVLEAVERDITSLNNDFKFKKLISYIDELYKDSSIAIDDLYKKGWDAKGPWDLIGQKIRNDLEESDAMKERIEQLIEKTKDQQLQYLVLKREKEEIFVVNQSLEKRLGDAQSKAEKVPALEIEKKRLVDKEKNFLQQIEKATKELEDLTNKEKDLRAKNEELEILVQSNVGRGSIRNTPGQGKQIASTTNAQARQQRTQSYFTKLANSSLSGKRDSIASSSTGLSRQQSISNSELQKQLQISEEVFQNVIMELQKDRMALRGKEMIERLYILEKGDGPFNQYIQKQRERRDMLKRISKDDQQKLEGVCENIGELKSKVKKEMALLKIVDLTKKNEEIITSSSADQESQIGKEKINYMILKAKDQVNDVYKTLFPKDLRLNAQPLLKVIQSDQKNDAVSNGVRIGSLKLQGLTQKKVINLDMKGIQELKSNLGVFSSSV